MSNRNEKHEDRVYKRDYALHKILMMFTALVICVVMYLVYEIINLKPPAPPALEGELVAPINFEEIDNRKELKLE